MKNCPIPATCLFALAVISSAAADEQRETAAAQPTPQPRIVAHRGLLRHAPENTLANFRTCLELRLGFEIDVQRSKDGHLVCVHDSTVNRTTNGSGKVGDMTLAELKRLDAGGWFAAEFQGEQIPTIDEIFALVAKYKAPSILIAVDLKGDDAQIERDVVRLANKRQVLDRLLFIGRAIQHPLVRQRLRQTDANAHVAAVANNAGEFSRALAAKHADWVYVRYLPSDQEAAQVHQRGKQMFIAGATVAGNQEANWRRVAAAGIDGILTDYPLALRQLLRE